MARKKRVPSYKHDDPERPITSALQKKFVEEYTTDFRGTLAALRAGYSKPGAAVEASRMLRTPNILAAIAKRCRGIVIEADITVQRLVDEYALIAFNTVNISDYFIEGEDGLTLKPSDEWTPVMSKMIKSINYGKDNSPGSNKFAIKIELRDRDAALLALSKYTGGFIERRFDLSVQTINHNIDINSTPESARLAKDYFDAINPS